MSATAKSTSVLAVPGSRPRARIEAFDTARGFYLAVIAAVHLLTNLPAGLLARPLMVAVRAMIGGTVAFVSMSGFMAGYALETRPDRREAMMARYRGSAIRLLAAHPVILFALWDVKRLTIAAHGLALRSWFITDTFAALFLTVVPLLPRLRARVRALAGAGMLLLGRALFVLHPGHSAAAVLLLDILAGPHAHGMRVLYENYALLPLGGMFLIGSRLGQGFARAPADDRPRRMGRRYLRAAPVLLALGAVLLAAWAVLRRRSPDVWDPAFYPDYYFSLYPIHLAGMLLVLGLLLTTEGAPRARHFLAVISRRSLVIYVVHYYLVQSLPFALHLYGRMTVPQFLLWLAPTLALLYLVARAFDRSWPRPGSALAQRSAD
jgi:hypothetical protein